VRVGILTTSFPRGDGDAAGRFVLAHARALAGDGHAVEVLAPEPDADGRRRWGTRPPHWPGVVVRWVPYARPRELGRTFYRAGAPDNLARDPVAWAGGAVFTGALAVHARRAVERWDRVVSHWLLPSGLVGTLVAGGPAQPEHHAVAHSSDVALLARLPARHALARRLARRSSVLRFTYAGLRDRFLALLPPGDRAAAAARSVVAPMPPEATAPPPSAETRRAARRALDLPEDAFVAAVIGRLVPVKGVDVAVAALRRLPSDVHLVIAGDGPERPRLERLARPLGRRVRFLGQLPPDAVARCRHAGDVQLAPSRPLPDGRTEGAPVSVAEALAAGLPVIASATGGLPEMLGEGERGELVTPGDPEALARAMEASRGRSGREG